MYIDSHSKKELYTCQRSDVLGMCTFEMPLEDAGLSCTGGPGSTGMLLEQ